MDSGSESGTEAGLDGGDAGPGACVPDATADGCFICPQTNSQILNQCSPSGDQCIPFSNPTRLPFWDGGMLPPAP
jgi:hypothetical protein